MSVRYRYQTEIQQMMFVFGEVQDPLQETTMLIEDIVRSQVIEICIMAAAQAHKRGSRYMSTEDLIFLIRHDRPKVTRLKEYLSWKDVRRNVKDREGDAGDDIIDEAAADKPTKSGKKKVKLSWELANCFSENLLENDDDEDDIEASNMHSESLKRLRYADEVTKRMTRDEYVHYSECRQASFTYRKGKKFRDWASMSSYIDVKPNDDIIDILGFLTFEMVSTVTETALAIKKDLDRAAANVQDITNGILTQNEQSTSGGDSANSVGTNSKKRKAGSMDAGNESISLFSGPPTIRSPLEAKHVHEAFRRLQRSPQPIKNFRGGLVRTRVSLI
ncbi:Transcription initiation protein spt3 [Mycoemilia scoparia]|uniref:Transcription initiation protein spt3 n=1 Tax=Mycoemilia scoparia TaxID=417184 RepID=A0A9W8DS21_9FUNG|nr:Transcription initiation protein spt3 [Mycoemilia scoparia]